jgi:hypothetical protein
MAGQEPAASDAGKQPLRLIQNALTAILLLTVAVFMLIAWFWVSAITKPHGVSSADPYWVIDGWLGTLFGLVVMLQWALYFARPAVVPLGLPASHWPRLAGMVGMWIGTTFAWWSITVFLVSNSTFWVDNSWAVALALLGPVYALVVAEAVRYFWERRRASREGAREGA